MGTPTKLGKYALDATPLGQGAMGVVYKGFDPDLRQAVAIKVIRRELVDGPGGEHMRQRFKNKAIAGRRLRHRNIVPVYEYGEDEDCSYIVMAFVEGRPLKEALDAGTRSSIAEALAITEQLLNALQHAHRNNVVHRDCQARQHPGRRGRPASDRGFWDREDRPGGPHPNRRGHGNAGLYVPRAVPGGAVGPPGVKPARSELWRRISALAQANVAGREKRG